MRTPTVAICIAVASLLVPAAAADAQQPKPRKFWITFTASQNTTWNQPEIETVRNCYAVDHHKAKGSEKWMMKTRARVPALFLVIARVPVLYVGTHDLDETTTIGSFEVGTQRTRERTERGWTTPGTCGGDTVNNPISDDDCGTRLPTLDISPSATGVNGGRLEFTVGTDSLDPNIDFDNCNMIFPPEITGDRFYAQEAAVHWGSFKTAKRALRVTYNKTFRLKPPKNQRQTTSRTHVKWTFTFTPAR